MSNQDDDFARDLNPEPMAGMNVANEGSDTTQGTPASEVKDLRNALPNIPDAHLKNIPIIDEGTRLEQGKKYIDLNKLDEGEFTGMAYHEATPGSRFVAKDAVDYDTWNRLRGHDERTR